ncbi:nuclear transport factor 2 family protein [Granulicella sp. S156]|uniref:nuclear transport factor 2 family protein n=1 Tax=Granulicella sp. S156 TaxID=1747224 RepID=UPI00131B241C|nr:nuclear transport factor 2 family protein [Granulicella sp. S156]
MYHAIVRKIARQNFERVNRKEYEAILAGCAPNIRHRFGGLHSMGGTRHDLAALRRWFERLGHVSPTLHLTVKDVWVKGWPHNTVVIMRWESTGTNADGSAYENHGVHIIRMRWGKVVDIDANEDSQAVAESLKIQGRNGIAEAVAEPIIS